MSISVPDESVECCWCELDDGSWAITGPARLLRPGRDVPVRLHSGAVEVEHILAVGVPYLDGDGVEAVYGYTASSRGGAR